MNRPAKPRPIRNLFVPILLGASLLIAGCGQKDGGEARQTPPLAGADIGGPFELVDKNGQTVRWADFAGKYRVVYFGYTYCPDICPLDVQRMARGLKKLEQDDPAKAEKIQAIFISVDPERDTPDKVGQFAAAFSDDIIGLTGTPQQVKQAADNFRVYYEKGETNSAGGYLVNHSNITFLFGPNGEPLATLPTDINDGGEAIAAELAKWVN